MMKYKASLNQEVGFIEKGRPKQKASFLWLLIPLTIFVAMMTLLLIERSGVPYQVEAASSHFLQPAETPAPSGYTEPAVESLVLYDSSFPSERYILDTVADTLDSLRVRYEEKDVYASQPVDLTKYKTVVVTFHKLDDMAQIRELIDWVEQGGRVLFAARPFFSQNDRSLYRKLGLISMADMDVVVHGLVFNSDILPGAKGVSLVGVGDFLKYYAYPVQLEETSHLHLTSADDLKLPLMWDADFGQGRFVVFNTSQLAERVNRGIIGAAYSLLEDVFVYPVINSSTFLIDNFPAPIVEGNNEFITQEFHRDIRSFFVNVWWPDMEGLANHYNLKYTGELVETYNDRLKPPFPPENSVEDHRYLGRMLLNMGGELALQGYNHIPYCLSKDGVNIIHGYPDWPSLENQQQAMQAQIDFSQRLYPGKKFVVYAPPAYVLCPDARQWIPKAFPEIKVISSVLVEEEVETYVQDFEEAPDGIIEFPRIVAGYYLYDYMKLALLNELGLQYVNSHLISADDILDPVRRDDRPWKLMRAQFEDQVKWLQENAPGLRNMTVEEGGMAVQRFSRLKVIAALEQNTYTIHLGNFYDEAWLMLRTTRQPLSITGGKITQVTSRLYLIQADKPDIQIQIKGP
jgi:hypothetical protein